MHKPKPTGFNRGSLTLALSSPNRAAVATEAGVVDGPLALVMPTVLVTYS